MDGARIKNDVVGRVTPCAPSSGWPRAGAHGVTRPTRFFVVLDKLSLFDQEWAWMHHAKYERKTIATSFGGSVKIWPCLRDYEKTDMDLFSQALFCCLCFSFSTGQLHRTGFILTKIWHVDMVVGFSKMEMFTHNAIKALLKRRANTINLKANGYGETILQTMLPSGFRYSG